MTNISRFAYIATWNGEQLTKGLMSSRQLFAAQKKIVEDARTPMERYHLGQKNLGALLEKFPNLASQKLRLEQDLEKQYLRQESALRKLTMAEKARLKELGRLRPDSVGDAAGDKGRNTASMIRRAAGVGVAGYTASQVGRSLVGASVEAVTESERTEAGFRTFTRDAAGAAELMESLRVKSRETGVNIGTMATGVERLLQARFGTGEALDTMQRLAEVAGGSSERMNRLTIALGQVKDMGRLQAEELGQLRESGWNPMIEIMKLTGLSAAEVRKEMERGRISFEMVAAALKSATDAGGQFHGRLDEVAKTVAGSMDKAAAATALAAEKAGKSLGPMITEWYNLKAAIMDAAAAAASDNWRGSNFFASMSAGITQWHDPAKAAGIMQKSFEDPNYNATGFVDKEVLDRGHELDRRLAESRKRVLEEEKQRNAARQAEADQEKMLAARQRAMTAPTVKGREQIEAAESAMRKQMQQMTEAATMRGAAAPRAGGGGGMIDLQDQSQGYPPMRGRSPESLGGGDPLRGESMEERHRKELAFQQRLLELRKKLRDDGLNENEVQRVLTIERQTKSLKDQTDEIERQAQRKKYLEDRAERGLRMVRGEELDRQKDLEDLGLALQRGMINQQEFEIARRKIQTGGNSERERPKFAPSMAARSQEAYQFFAGLDNWRPKPQQVQTVFGDGRREVVPAMGPGGVLGQRGIAGNVVMDERRREEIAQRRHNDVVQLLQATLQVERETIDAIRELDLTNEK